MNNEAVMLADGLYRMTVKPAVKRTGYQWSVWHAETGHVAKGNSKSRERALKIMKGIVQTESEE